ncbi:MAG: MFS transporter [Spirochaetes bacterium]|nr:MFS transporter [Spirochaetota bacterium]
MEKSEKTVNYRLLLMIGCCGALAIFSSTISKSPILPIFAAQLGASGAQIGIIASMSTIPGILISFLAGYLADKYGYKRILVGSLLVFASAPFLYLLVYNPLQLGAVRFYHGFATAAFGPVAMAAVAAFSGKNTGQNLSIYSSATMVGRALAPSVGGAAYDVGGHSYVYVIAAVAGTAALVLALWFFLRPGRAEDAPAAGKGEVEKPAFVQRLVSLLKYKPLLFVGLLSACVYFAYGAFEMIFPLYARHLGMSPVMIGVLLSAQLVAVIVFKPFFGRASDKLGRLPMIITGLFVCAFSFFTLAFVQSVLVLGAVIVVYGLGFALTTAAANALAADVASAGALGASLGLMSTIMDVGQTLGPPSIGAISDAHSFPAGIVVLGGILFLAGCACSVWHLRQKLGKR